MANYKIIYVNLSPLSEYNFRKQELIKGLSNLPNIKK